MKCCASGFGPLKESEGISVTRDGGKTPPASPGTVTCASLQCLDDLPKGPGKTKQIL